MKKGRKNKILEMESEAFKLDYTRVDNNCIVEFNQIMSNTDNVLQLLCVIDQNNAIQDNYKLNQILDSMLQEMNDDVQLNTQIIETSVNNGELDVVKLQDCLKYKFNNLKNVVNLPQILTINCQLDGKYELEKDNIKFCYPLTLDFKGYHECVYQLYGVILEKKQNLYTAMVAKNLHQKLVWFEITDTQIIKVGVYSNDNHLIVDNDNACMLFYHKL